MAGIFPLKMGLQMKIDGLMGTIHGDVEHRWPMVKIAPAERNLELLWFPPKNPNLRYPKQDFW